MTRRRVVLAKAKPSQPTCRQPACPEWPDAPALPGHHYCAVCRARLEVKAARARERWK